MGSRVPQNAIIYTPDGQSLTVDVSLSQRHKVSVDTTDFPVEQGADITDHLRRRPDSVTIEGFVSNTPVEPGFPVTTYVAGTQGFSNQNFTDYDGESPQLAKTAHEYLDALTYGPQLATVVTPLKTYSDMALIDLDMPKSVATGDVFQFTAVFKRIFTVTNATVTVLTRAPNGQTNKNTGKQATTQATAAQKSGSFLFRTGQSTGFTNAMKNLLGAGGG